VTVTFYGPLGDIIEDDLDQIRALVLQAGEEYWLAGSGTGLILLGAIGSCPSIVMMVKAPHGAVLVLDLDDYEYYSCRADDSTHESVRIWVGGEPEEIPLQCFVPREQAWKAIEEFVATGRRPTGVGWKPADQVLP
jgi:hypothetical protein